jgi:hypothetical protein
MYRLVEMDYHMNEFLENGKRAVNVLKARPWLFTDNPYISIEKYIKYFEYGKKSDFHIFSTMLPYKVDLLDKYKDNVYNTMFLPTGPALLGMHTLIQVNPNLHLVIMWGNSSNNRETTLYITLHAASASDYVKFLKEHEDFIYDDEKPQGFFAPPKS